MKAGSTFSLVMTVSCHNFETARCLELLPLTENGELRAVQEMLTTGRSAQLEFIVGMKEARLMNRKPEDARRYVAGTGLVQLQGLSLVLRQSKIANG